MLASPASSRRAVAITNSARRNHAGLTWTSRWTRLFQTRENRRDENSLPEIQPFPKDSDKLFSKKSAAYARSMQRQYPQEERCFILHRRSRCVKSYTWDSPKPVRADKPNLYVCISSRTRLDVQVLDIQGVVLNKLAAWLDRVAHQDRKYLIRLHRVVYFNL
jgi:hypothetical protein